MLFLMFFRTIFYQYIWSTQQHILTCCVPHVKRGPRMWILHGHSHFTCNVLGLDCTCQMRSIIYEMYDPRNYVAHENELCFTFSAPWKNMTRTGYYTSHILRSSRNYDPRNYVNLMPHVSSILYGSRNFLLRKEFTAFGLASCFLWCNVSPRT